MSETTDPDALDGQALLLMAKAATLRAQEELLPVLASRIVEAATAEALRQQAGQACMPLDETVRALTAERSELSDRAALAARAVGSPELSARLDARVRVAACAEEREELSGRLAQARADAAAARAAFRLAEREAARAQAAQEAAAAALRSPLESPLGQATQAYRRFIVNSGLWLLEPKSAVTRSLVTDLLGPTGIGAQVQREAVRAYLAGDPAALAAGGTDRLPDGSVVTHSPGQPALVSRPRLSGPQAQNAMTPVPAVPADAMARARSAASGVIS